MVSRITKEANIPIGKNLCASFGHFMCPIGTTLFMVQCYEKMKRDALNKIDRISVFVFGDPAINAGTAFYAGSTGTTKKNKKHKSTEIKKPRSGTDEVFFIT